MILRSSLSRKKLDYGFVKARLGWLLSLFIVVPPPFPFPMLHQGCPL